MSCSFRFRRLAGAGLAGALLLTLAGCTTVSGIVKTQAILDREGYKDPGVSFANDSDTVTFEVTYRTDARDVPALAKEYADVARVVWQQAPLSFDAVKVRAKDAPGTCAEDCVDRFTRDDLVNAHGPRDSSLDRSIERELLGVGLAVLAVILIAAILLVWLLVRSRRQARLRAQGGYLPGGSVGYLPPGYQPPGYPPAGYGPPQQPPPPPTPHASAPGYEAPPPGYLPPPPSRAPARRPGPPPIPRPQPAAQWPPATPPPSFEQPPEPPPTPTHDIWQRPPS